MKRIVLLIILLTCFTFLVNGQYRVLPNKPYTTLGSTPGWLSINELTGGIGLHHNTKTYTKYFFGFTTVNGYQVNRNFFAGAGTGLSFYESGLLIPLFLDFRFAFNVSKFTPYVFGDGGLLLQVSDLNSTKLFINPGAGVRYSLGRKFAVNAGAGIISQVDGKNRASFVNVKLGGIYVF
jgi:hypothetical protein